LFIRRALPCAIDEKAFSLPHDAKKSVYKDGYYIRQINILLRISVIPLFDKRVYWNLAGTTLSGVIYPKCHPCGIFAHHPYMRQFEMHPFVLKHSSSIKKYFISLYNNFIIFINVI
jgi:hypothetical protein